MTPIIGEPFNPIIDEYEVMSIAVKRCIHCKQERPLTDFYPSRKVGTVTYYRSDCKYCNKVYLRRREKG